MKQFETDILRNKTQSKTVIGGKGFPPKGSGFEGEEQWRTVDGIVNHFVKLNSQWWANAFVPKTGSTSTSPDTTTVVETIIQQQTVENLVCDNIIINESIGDGTTAETSTNVVNHPSTNNQAHTDYLRNRTSTYDTLDGSLRITGYYSGASTTDPMFQILDNSNYPLFYVMNSNDDTGGDHKRIGIGTASPAGTLHVSNDDANAFKVTTSGKVVIGDNATTPTSKCTITQTSEQLKLKYDDSNWAKYSVGISGGSQIESSGGNFVFDFGSSSSSVLPSSHLETDLGAWNQQFKGLYVGEIYAETLVAQDVLATIGGRITVCPTTELVTSDINTTADNIIVKHNSAVNGDFLYFKKFNGTGPQFEVMKIISGPSGSNEEYVYVVTRSVDDGAPNSWTVGDACLILSDTVNSGFMELTSTSTSLGNLGPSLHIYNRHSATNWLDYYSTVAIGNLKSVLDISVDKFGIAIGDNLSIDVSPTSKKFIMLEPDTGLRLNNVDLKLYNSGTHTVNIENDGDVFLGKDISSVNTTTFTHFATDHASYNNSESFTAGDILFGSNSSGYANMLWDVDANSSKGALKIRTGTTDSAVFNEDGSGTLAQGNISWTDAGVLTIGGYTPDAELEGFNVYYQDAFPNETVVPAPGIGDLWYDTNAGNKPHRCTAVSLPTMVEGDWTAINYTTIDGGEITTGIITSSDDKTFFDLENDFIKIDSDIPVIIGDDIIDQGVSSQDDILIGSWANQASSSSAGHGILVKHGTGDYSKMYEGGFNRRGFNYPILIYEGLHCGWTVSSINGNTIPSYASHGWEGAGGTNLRVPASDHMGGNYGFPSSYTEVPDGRVLVFYTQPYHFVSPFDNDVGYPEDGALLSPFGSGIQHVRRQVYCHNSSQWDTNVAYLGINSDFYASMDLINAFNDDSCDGTPFFGEIESGTDLTNFYFIDSVFQSDQGSISYWNISYIQFWEVDARN